MMKVLCNEMDDEPWNPPLEHLEKGLLRMICPAGVPWVGHDAIAGSDHGHTDCMYVGETIKRLREQHAAIVELREALKDALEYARHDEGCSGAFGEKYRCRCLWRVEEPRLRALLRQRGTPGIA